LEEDEADFRGDEVEEEDLPDLVLEEDLSLGIRGEGGEL